MYTRRLNQKVAEKANLRRPAGSAARSVVHFLSERDLLELTIAYANARPSKQITELAEIVLHALGEIGRTPNEVEDAIVDRAALELTHDLSEFRSALTWMCSEKIVEKSISIGVSSLRRVEWGRGRLIGRDNERFVSYFEAHGLKNFQRHLSLQQGILLSRPRLHRYVDLFCAYVLDLTLDCEPSEMPIKICPNCQMFFASQRNKYCSSRCQWKNYWTPERRKHDKWVRDLEVFLKMCKPRYGRSIRDLRSRLSTPKAIQRIAAIRQLAASESWSGWANVIERLNSVERAAAKMR